MYTNIQYNSRNVELIYLKQSLNLKIDLIKDDFKNCEQKKLPIKNLINLSFKETFKKLLNIKQSTVIIQI